MPAIDVKQAIKFALDHAKNVYEDVEQIEDPRLEEVEYDEPTNKWLVTVSFLREQVVDEKTVFDEARGVSLTKALAALGPHGLFGSPGDKLLKRTYRIIVIDADSGCVKSMKIRMLV